MSLGRSVQCVRCAATILVCGTGLLTVGCQLPQPNTPPSGPAPAGYPSIFGHSARRENRPTSGAIIDPEKIPPRDDVVSIQQFWNPYPWLTDRGSGKIVGFGVPVYFVSAQTEKGVFVPGTILASLFEVRRTREGPPQRIPLHLWELDARQALRFRVRKQAVGGYYYGFLLTWPDDLNLHGREIEVGFSYRRLDGTVVDGPLQRFRVPVPLGWQPATGRTSGVDREPGAPREVPSDPAAGAASQPGRERTDLDLDALLEELRRRVQRRAADGGSGQPPTTQQAQPDGPLSPRP